MCTSPAYMDHLQEQALKHSGENRVHWEVRHYNRRIEYRDKVRGLLEHHNSHTVAGYYPDSHLLKGLLHLLDIQPSSNLNDGSIFDHKGRSIHKLNRKCDFNLEWVPSSGLPLSLNMCHRFQHDLEGAYWVDAFIPGRGQLRLEHRQDSCAHCLVLSQSS